MTTIRTAIFFLLTITLAACAPPTPTSAPAQTIQRTAVFTEVENDVRAQTNADDEPAPAEIGQSLAPGGSAQSGEDSRARLDLLPDGTIIRLGPNSLFQVADLDDGGDGPFTRLQLISGQIWIVLSGGELETDTPYGTASVRGSIMSVDFDPAADGLTVTCLEGHCALANDAGSVELTEGFASVIAAKGEPPSPPREITAEERNAWTQASPEAEAFLNDAPPPPPPEILPALLATLQPAPPPPPSDGGNAPPPSGPLKYDLTNNCPDEVWFWQFEGPVSRSFSIPPGGSESGQLPAGTYTVTDWLSGGQRHGPNITPSGGTLSVSACPDQ